MPTISSRVSKKELDAINEFANACGETVSNLLRKVAITEATFLHGFGGANDYNYSISVPVEASGKEDDRITQNAYNKIRRILGFEEIEL
jgi:hypothetical protein